MFKRSLLALTVLTLAACQNAPVGSPLPNPTPGGTAVGGNWSDPATWGGQVPGDGAVLSIPAGKRVILDTKTAVLKSLTIDGELIAADQDVEITADWIMVHGAGRFQIGSEAQPYTKKATVNLAAKSFNEEIMGAGSKGMGTKFLGTMMGGTLELHGQPKLSWTKLAASAKRGEPVLTLKDAPQGWQVGDQIAVAPSDFKATEAEQRFIVKIEGNRVTLDKALEFDHWGEAPQTYGRFSLDMLAEVGNLTRNIVVRGVNNVTVPIKNETKGGRATDGVLGGHMMFMEGSTVKLSSVEVTQMGQQGGLGRYPVHFHLLQDGGVGSYVRGLAIHNTFQRGLVLHQTNNLEVRDNFIFNVPGHAVFIEDGIERNNRFERNLVMLVRYVPDKLRLSKPDGFDGTPRADRQAGFWITNPMNTFKDNAVAGVEHGWGFTFEGVRTDKDPVVKPDDARWAENVPLKEFSGNTAHSIGFLVSPPDGMSGAFVLNYGPEEAGSCFRFLNTPYHAQLLAQSQIPTRLSAYKCANAGFWGVPFISLTDSIVADSRISGQNDNGPNTVVQIKDSMVVAFSRNNPGTRSNFNGPGAFYGPLLFGVADGNAVLKLENVTAVGQFSNDDNGYPTAFNAGSVASSQDFKISFNPSRVLIRAGGTARVTVQVDRLGGYAGPINVQTYLRYNVNDANYPIRHVKPASLTIPAGATGGTLEFRMDNPAANLYAFSSYAVVVASTGGYSKVELLPVNAVNAPRSEPGVNLAKDTDNFQFSYPLAYGGPEGGLSNAFNDGDRNTWFYAGTWYQPVQKQPWVEVSLERSQNIGEIRLYDAAGLAAQIPYGSPSGTSNFCVFVSDFPIEGVTLEQALTDPSLWHQCFDGQMAKPTVLTTPTGTTGRFVRVWARGEDKMSVAELEVIGR